MHTYHQPRRATRGANKAFMVPICVVVLMFNTMNYWTCALGYNMGPCADVWGGCFARVKNRKIIK